MQAVAAEFSGCAENHLRSSSYGVSAKRERSRHSEATAEFYCFLEREEFKKRCFDSFIFKTCSYTDAQRLFKSFLTRNELVDSQWV